MIKEVIFEQKDEKHIKIIGILDDGTKKEVGQIFTPSGSGECNFNAIQVCGFQEAFDLWGCAVYEYPAEHYPNSVKLSGTYVRDELNNEIVYQQAKDIQLVFNSETRNHKQSYRKDTIENCPACFNKPCTCEVKTRYGNPYVVKREQDLFLLKKGDEKSSSNQKTKANTKSS